MTGSTWRRRTRLLIAAPACWLLAMTAPVRAASANPATPDPTEGDRTALIVQDMAQHPPQADIPSQDPSHLQTTRLKLGGLLDRSVRGTENSEVGRVIDVMTGDDGKPEALELDVGGFMGVGNRKIAVAWNLFDLSRTDPNQALRVALSEAQVRSAPAAEGSGTIAVVTGAAPAAAKPATGTGKGQAQEQAPAQTQAQTQSAPAAAGASRPEPHPAPAPAPAGATHPGDQAAPGGSAGADGRF